MVCRYSPGLSSGTVPIPAPQKDDYMGKRVKNLVVYSVFQPRES